VVLFLCSPNGEAYSRPGFESYKRDWN